MTVKKTPFVEMAADGHGNGSISIGDLVPDRLNRRRHTPRNIGMVAAALEQVGTARSIVIDEDGVVLAGNGTVEAATSVGITKVQVVECDGSTLVAVRRRGLSAEQKRALSLFDNRAAELAEWDLNRLATDAAANMDLMTFFEPADLADLLHADAPVPAFVEAEESLQGRLDQLAPRRCPRCGHEFRP